MLPEIKKVKDLPIFTPTKWQTVVLRNYGLVKNSVLAKVLRTNVKTIVTEAQRLGLNNIEYTDLWVKKGYITIIRNNWNILPYNQIITLLGFSESYFDYILKEDDFLSVKLGGFKPYCDEVYYSPLTSAEIIKTEEIKKEIKSVFIDDYCQPLDFYKFGGGFSESNGDDFDRIVYGYSMLYGDTLYDGGEIISDEQLKTYKSVGVNGIWFQGVLSKLATYPFVKGRDKGYKVRRKNLNKLIARCRKFGIGVFLYFNEPRALPLRDFNEKTIKLKGREFEGDHALCTETQEVQEYLYNAFYDFAKAVPDLEGILTITMSENLTNCFARPNNNCPICSKKPIFEVVPKVNNIIYKAIKDGNGKTRLIANLWGWNKNFDWTDEDVRRGIDNLSDGIEILCISEMGTVTKNGKKIHVGEYSISNVGPCEETVNILSYAKEKGHKIWAKVQVNNSWEFPIIPYIPVFKLVEKHLTNLKSIGLSGLMASWTLGGYPSASLCLAKNVFSKDYDYNKWLKGTFGDDYAKVEKAVDLFSDAFTEYPFCMETLYFGAHAMGAVNPVFVEKTERKATMVCFPYDDVEGWCGSFKYDDYIAQLDKMCNKWRLGVEMLKDLSGNSAFNDLKRYANVFYVNMQSTLNQSKYYIARNNSEPFDFEEFKNKEKELCLKLYKLASEDCRVGFEASNHYYFTQNSFLERILNLNSL